MLRYHIDKIGQKYKLFYFKFLFLSLLQIYKNLPLVVQSAKSKIELNGTGILINQNVL